MRGYAFYIVFAMLFIVWIVSKSLAPDWSDAVVFGMIGWIGWRVMEMDMYSHTYGGHAPNLSVTLVSTVPSARVIMPALKESPDLDSFGIWPLGGTHIAGFVGGRKSGFMVCPMAYAELIEGEMAQIFWNIVWHVYRENADLDAEERPLNALPQLVLDELKKQKNWVPDSPVFFGYIPWQTPHGDKVKGVNLKDILDWQNAYISQLTEQRTSLLDASSRIAKSFPTRQSEFPFTGMPQQSQEKAPWEESR